MRYGKLYQRIAPVQVELVTDVGAVAINCADADM
jgi:hypothetical protein